MILAGLIGALAKQFIDAVLGNPAMAEALGVASGRPTDAMVALTQLYIAIIATAYAVQAVGALRGEETAGRLEVRLSGTLSRVRWLAAHGLVTVVGLLAIVILSSLVLAAGTTWSTGTALDVGRILAAGAAYLPAELLVAGLQEDGGTTLFRSVSSDEDGGKSANIAASGASNQTERDPRGARLASGANQTRIARRRAEPGWRAAVLTSERADTPFVCEQVSRDIGICPEAVVRLAR